MTAKRKIDSSVQRKFYFDDTDEFYAEKGPKHDRYKVKKQDLSNQYSISDWFDSEEELPLT